MHKFSVIICLLVSTSMWSQIKTNSTTKVLENEVVLEEEVSDTVEYKVDLDLLVIIFELVLWLHEDLGDEDMFGSDYVAWIL